MTWLTLCGIAVAAALSSAAGAQPHLTRAVASARAAAVADTAFSHPQHAGLFPLCSGCHRDVTAADPARVFPPASACAECHNGRDQELVTWRPPARPAPQGLLAFSHQGHFARTDSAGRSCQSCHAIERSAVPRALRYMDVGHAAQTTCSGCHEHRAAHFAPESNCRTCHVPLTRAVALSNRQVAGLPQPSSHALPEFVLSHAPAAGQEGSCATCHARESCQRCHVNAARVPGIAALGTDARVAAVTRSKVPNYPVPDTHRREAFKTTHGTLVARDGATCATCHAKASCTGCHTGPAAQAQIRLLPDATPRTPGVRLLNAGLRGPLRPVAQVADTGRRVVRVHPRDFESSHRVTAASGDLTCAGCHSQRFCAACHAGETRRAFHPANFLAGHSADQYAADANCASCHNTEVFCRSCHVQLGLGSRVARGANFHNAQPQWLLQHGRAARQDLRSCTTCHAQQTCMRCHATTGWGVSPHGADFNATRLGGKAMAMCARCHITDPRKR